MDYGNQDMLLNLSPNRGKSHLFCISLLAGKVFPAVTGYLTSKVISNGADVDMRSVVDFVYYFCHDMS